MFGCNDTVSAVPFPFKYQSRGYCILQQNIYDKITLYLLNYGITRFIIINIHKSLYYFRYFCIRDGDFIEKYMSLNMLVLIMSIIASRLHFAGSLIICYLLFIRLDFAVLFMLRFYKGHMEIFKKNFPQAYSLQKRGGPERRPR